MALVLKDRVLETTTTTGTGPITLAGAMSGFQSFSTIGNGNTCYYTIDGGSEWEVGVGTYTASGSTLSRDSVLDSSNSGNLVNFSAGTKRVFVTYPADSAVTLNDAQTLTNKTISMAGVLQLDASTPIASGATVDLSAADGNDVTVTHSTGDTAITSFGAASAIQAGTRTRVRASISGGTLTLTHNATSMIIPGGADWELADGDSFDAVKISDSQAYWRVENITLASGQALNLPPFTITDGASVDINPANGDIQVWTLGANRTPTATNFDNGQSVTLLIDDGAAYAITWTIVDKWFGGAPTLSTDEPTGIVLFKAGGVVYGAALSEIAA